MIDVLFEAKLIRSLVNAYDGLTTAKEDASRCNAQDEYRALCELQDRLEATMLSVMRKAAAKKEPS